MIINVCKKDMRDGEIGQYDTCMVSLAVLRALRKKKKNNYAVTTTYSQIVINEVSYKITQTLKSKIKLFDDGLILKPFKIKLDEKTNKASVA